MKAVRIALVGFVASGALLVTPGTASATCRPEKPSTCKPEFPPVQEPQPDCTLTIPGPDGEITIVYC